MTNYTDIMYDANNDSPITLTFKRAGLKYVLAGEGGNHRITLQDADGQINLWVDDQTADGHVFVHIPSVNGKPDSALLTAVYAYMREYCSRDDRIFYHFSFSGFNKFFRELYKYALVKSQLWKRVCAFDENAA